MTLALAAVAGYLAGRLLWTLLRPTLTQPGLMRPNWRDHPVPTAVGVVVPLAVLVVEGGRVVAGAAGVGAAGIDAGRTAVVLVVAGMGMAGLLDDLATAAGDDARGFRGHLRELAGGRLTTGGAKLFVGLAVAVVAVAAARPRHGGIARLAADAALVALAANLANLLDRRPGRSAKVGLVSFVALVALASGRDALVPVAVVAGAGAALLLDDLRERLMLGDAGANAVGGALGVGVVVSCAPTTRTGVLLVVGALNLMSEVVSFGRVIEAVPPLRALDRWGRRS